jgi:DNA-directed RNA polymerase specialized sigma24 family protein
MFDSVRDFADRLRRTGYFIDPVMTQVVFLAIKLRKPLLLEGPAGSGKGQKKPSTYKGCGKRQKRTRGVEKSCVMWKSGLISGTLAVLTRHLRPIRSQSDFAHCSVMASPSPLDRCWVLKRSSATTPLMQAMRAAVEQHWPDLQRSAGSALGDESLADEIMEKAIEQAVAYLTDHPPENQEHVNAILFRFWREEVARRRKQNGRLVFIDCSTALEPHSSDSQLVAADAAIDAERILQDAPPKVREAIMMRYGSSDSWDDVAAMTATTPAAIRMSCKRFIDRIRQKLGILGAGH